MVFKADAAAGALRLQQSPSSCLWNLRCFPESLRTLRLAALEPRRCNPARRRDSRPRTFSTFSPVACLPSRSVAGLTIPRSKDLGRLAVRHRTFAPRRGELDVGDEFHGPPHSPSEEEWGRLSSIASRRPSAAQVFYERVR